MLIGALITFGANVYLALRRERADAARERRERELALKRAARLVHLELMQAKHIFETACATNAWEPSFEKHISSEQWKAHSSVLALELSAGEWAEVVLGYLFLQSGLTYAQASDDRFSGEGPSILKDTAEKIGRAAEALGHHIGISASIIQSATSQ